MLVQRMQGFPVLSVHHEFSSDVLLYTSQYPPRYVNALQTGELILY